MVCLETATSFSTSQVKNYTSLQCRCICPAEVGTLPKATEEWPPGLRDVGLGRKLFVLVL